MDDAQDAWQSVAQRNENKRLAGLSLERADRYSAEVRLALATSIDEVRTIRAAERQREREVAQKRREAESVEYSLSQKAYAARRVYRQILQACKGLNR